MKDQKLNVNDVDFSTFNLTHIHRTSFDMGDLIPIACVPTLPRDRLEVTMSNFIRAMPTKVPMMDNLDLKINHFYIPYRLLWNGFEQFISLAHNGRIDTEVLPLVAISNADQGTTPNYPNGRLADYLGIGAVDTSGGAGQGVNAMPFLAYHKIYLDHYAPKRWVNYTNPDGTVTQLNQLRDFLEEIRVGDGGSPLETISAEDGFLGRLRKVNFNHDYFTNALPTPTLFEDMKLPLFTTSPDLLDYDTYEGDFQISGGDLPFSNDPGSVVGNANYEKLATIRDLRKSISLQHYLEKLQQTGGGYIETMKIHWNQDLPNDLLQRSEYLGGAVTDIFNNEVESNADTVNIGSSGAGQGLGSLAGKPIGGGTDETVYCNSDEFGIYMAIAHVVPKRSYANAISRMWLDITPTEFPNPDFENIGDQTILRKELTGDFSHTTIWGYVPRYSQYKTALDRFSGEMRTSLKDWHMGTFKTELEEFPTISPEFMEANVREDVFQVPGEPDKLLGTFKIDIKALRPLQNTSRPGIGYI